MSKKTVSIEKILIIGQGMRRNCGSGCAFFGFLTVSKALAQNKTVR